jgi:hypothetical protein
MKRAFGLAALSGLALATFAGAVNAQSYGPIDTRPGGVVGGPAAVLPDARTRPPGADNNRAPSGYTASRTTCYKDGKEVDRAYCESDQFYWPDRVPGMELYSLRCSNANTNYNPVTNSYIGLDGIQRNCR